MKAELIRSYLCSKDQNLENYACHIHNSENVQDGINEFPQQINADLVATATHGRSGFARLFNGSITEDLKENTLFPVLTAKIDVE